MVKYFLETDHVSCHQVLRKIQGQRLHVSTHWISWKWRPSSVRRAVFIDRSASKEVQLWRLWRLKSIPHIKRWVFRFREKFKNQNNRDDRTMICQEETNPSPADVGVNQTQSQVVKISSGKNTPKIFLPGNICASLLKNDGKTCKQENKKISSWDPNWDIAFSKRWKCSAR